MEKNLIKISDASRILGVAPNTLRIWEKRGLLVPVRTFGKHRRYNLLDIKKLAGGRNEDSC
jgi:DNA-binding transcriptional MerR regulator